MVNSFHMYMVKEFNFAPFSLASFTHLNFAPFSLASFTHFKSINVRHVTKRNPKTRV